ncbi:GspE/PulE family protein [Chitiniphilus purpureus]|uniref:GspE/PulE family protein n=1 Tax=Chitiniphilus purpureus TaxID=2981137 RepID=A0ABY6DLK1_9NEIS|nr:GspE/PulE family protein [Chitiniphilus sp. CD1]UXY15249.1 GspE/PulE family protein [Chitiniphilus sp. CD1]
MNSTLDMSLGQALLQRGCLSADQLRIAQQEQRRLGGRLAERLATLGFVSEALLRDALAERLGEQSVALADAYADPAALALLPKSLARQHQVLPLAWDQDNCILTLAMANPADLLALDQLRRALPPCRIATRVASAADVQQAIDRCYGIDLSIDGILEALETGATQPGDGDAGSYGEPVVRLIDALLGDAVARGASDLHFEPEAGFVRIRYRIDGVLRQVRALHQAHWPAMSVRLKVMAGMDIAETRAPQDGRLSRSFAGRHIDFRAAIQPTTWGENLVLRILDRHSTLLPLAQLGFSSSNLAALRRLIARPEGLILVTGPTGSGKTTTLYSILGELDREALNIMTLEDPVEYPLPHIRQTSINEVAKLDFASGIRSLLRQDPDVILVGEIRDRDTAEMALRAAMTGHQVYATLHANGALGALPRLFELGVPPELLAGNLLGIVAQRLVRRHCPACHGRVPGDTPAAPYGDCRCCAGSGYRGRTVIAEVLSLDAAFDELLARRASPCALLEAARQRGFATLHEDARRLIHDGVTSSTEIARVIGPDWSES